MAYAAGKKSRARCDRCGFVYKYTELKNEWNGLKTCPECFEPKHPQLEPILQPVDPEALREPRPSEIPPTTGYGIVKTENTKNSLGVTGLSMNINHNDPIGSSFDLQTLEGSLGEVTIVT